ncbi:hypothetical protein [Chitinophaga sp. CCNWYY40]|uniref:hypothetical protein n=1 Tax=Chitinophaga sp. CCNWYY40 TaxID=3125796 RepID=UPI0030D7D3AF
MLDIHMLSLDQLTEEVPLLQLRDERIKSLEGELNDIISDLLLNRATNYYEGVTIMRYKDKSVKLNFRNSQDFYLGALINLFDIVALCNKMEGGLYIYNRNLFQEYQSDSILSFLRVHYRLSREGLKEGLNELWKRASRNKDKSIDYQELDAGLNHLQYYGLVFYDGSQKEYQLTARGYMFY